MKREAGDKVQQLHSIKHTGSNWSKKEKEKTSSNEKWLKP